MGTEIERKFLLANDGWRRAVSRSEAMRQGYIASGAASVRVRISGAEARLNIKAARLGAVRDEYEYAIPLRDGEEMLDRLARSGLVEKTRHSVVHDGFEWEIDEFHGENAGLCVAELELDEVGQEFPKPAWLGSEVTHLARYYNVSLVDRPYSLWTEGERLP
jgi:adenylate cyclase